MRLHQHLITELTEANLYKIIDILEDKCFVYLNELSSKGRINNLMYSGRKSNDSYMIKKIRKDREPKDSDQKSHDMMDSLFNKKFGFKARSNVLFATGDISTALSYGRIYTIWPVGQYKFIYSNHVTDLFDVLQRAKKIDTITFIKLILHLLLNPKKGVENKTVDYDKDKVNKILNTYKDDDIYKAINSGNEIMINCKEYVAISNPYTEKLIEYVNNR